MSHRNRSKLHTPPPSNIPYPHICKYAQNNFQKHTELFLQNCCRCCIPQCMCYPLSWYQEIFPTKSGNMLIDHFISWYWGISALIGSLMNHRSSNTHICTFWKVICTCQQEIMKVKLISPKKKVKVKQFQLISQVYCVGWDGLRCTQTTSGTGVKQGENSNNSL